MLVKGRQMTIRNQRGFTLIELMVVVLILGILAAIITPRIIGMTDDARVTEAKVQIRNLETALKLYKLDTGTYPTTEQRLDALIEKPATGGIPKKWREGGYLEVKKISPFKRYFFVITPVAGLYQKNGVKGDILK